MQYFFQFWPDIPKELTFGQFSATHLTAIILVGALLYVSIHAVKKLNKEAVQHVMGMAALVLALSEVARIVWISQVDSAEFVKLLPLHLCGLQILFIPLSIYTKSRAIQEFVFTTSLLGGIGATVFPSGLVDTYPFFHFQTIQTLLFHFILMFIPLVMYFCQGFRPRLSNVPKVMGILLGCALVAGWVDVRYGQNYMFLREPPFETPLVAVFNHGGQGVYLFTLLAMMTLGVVLCILPFREKKKPETLAPSHNTHLSV